MIKRMTELAFRYKVSIFIYVVIWILCLMPVPEMPMATGNLTDKWAHMLMFGTLTLCLGLEHRVYRKVKGEIKREMSSMIQTLRHPIVWLLPVVSAVLTELAQAFLTSGRRSGDPIDALADVIGVLFGVMSAFIIFRFLATHSKD